MRGLCYIECKNYFYNLCNVLLYTMIFYSMVGRFRLSWPSSLNCRMVICKKNAKITHKLILIVDALYIKDCA